MIQPAVALPQGRTAGFLTVDRGRDDKPGFNQLQAQRGRIPYVRIESNVRFSKHQVMRWLEERSFQPRSVHGKGARRR